MQLPDGELTVGQFYDLDPRRRQTNTRFGEDWSLECDPGYRYDLFWIEATGELYAMRAPLPGFAGYMPDGTGGSYVSGGSPDPTVRVLGTFSREQLDWVMNGWKEKVGQPNSLEWVEDRVDQIGSSEEVPPED